VPLPQRTLELLRAYWKTHRNQVLLFPVEGRNHLSIERMSKSRAQPIESESFGILITVFFVSELSKLIFGADKNPIFAMLNRTKTP
jgi:hypothetical protein